MTFSPEANKAYVQLNNFNIIKKNKKGILTAVRISSCSICSSSICCCFSSLSRDKRVRLFCSSRNCWRSLSRSSSCQESKQNMSTGQPDVTLPGILGARNKNLAFESPDEIRQCGHVNEPSVPMMTNINFLLTISIDCQEIRLCELIT